MDKLFNDILIPVFSSEELGVYAEKASFIAKQLEGNIQLLYINKNSTKPSFSLRGRKSMRRDSDLKFFDWQKERLTKMYPFLSFRYAIRNENFKNIICTYCLKHKIKLVIFFEKNNCADPAVEKNKMNISSFLEMLNCSVLTVKLQTGLITGNDIVLPIGSALPLKKLRIACYIGRIFHSTIHLVSLNKEFLMHGHEEAICLYKAYHLLHDNTGLPIKCKILDGQNILLATLQYAQKINADIVLLNSGKEPLLDESTN